MIKIDHLSDYHFGIVRPGYLPVKESLLGIAMSHYMVTVSGKNDRNLSFNLVNGMNYVQYSIFWKDPFGNFVHLFPNTTSSIFIGASDNTNANRKALLLATLKIQIDSHPPSPGHYADTLTFIITPA